MILFNIDYLKAFFDIPFLSAYIKHNFFGISMMRLTLFNDNKCFVDHYTNDAVGIRAKEQENLILKENLFSIKKDKNNLLVWIQCAVKRCLLCLEIHK